MLPVRGGVPERLSVILLLILSSVFVTCEGSRFRTEGEGWRLALAGTGGANKPHFGVGGEEDQTIANVMSFGATGNGSSDDTSAIQKAIDYIITREGLGASLRTLLSRGLSCF